MEQLIEVLQQIQDLAGVAIEALTGAAGGEQGGPPAPDGSPDGAGAAPEGGGAPPA